MQSNANGQWESTFWFDVAGDIGGGGEKVGADDGVLEGTVGGNCEGAVE